MDGIGLAIEKALRTLILTLCQLVYSMIVFFFNIFEKIGTASIVSDTYIMEVYERIGLILGLFMLFRITFSGIQYVINPDLLNDKKSGMGNIVKKAIIVIVLLGTTPYLFELAFKVQNLVIEEDILPKIIVGSTADTDNFGISLVDYTFFNFYTRNPEAGNLCTESQYNAMRNYFRNSGNLDMTKNCIDKYDESKEEWAINFDYHGILPLIVGVVLLWMIIMYTLQVAIRAFQLAYLQLIAPIPIMLYLDPKKDDQLQKWLKQCTTTYFDLFIRVAIIYFVVFVIEIIMSDEFFNTIDVSGGFFSNFYISVVLIIALLVFAKKVPDLFKELFPSAGGAAKFDFGLSPKKVLNDTMAAGLIGGVAGAAGATASNAVHGFMNMRKAWNKNPVDEKLTKEQREALGVEGAAKYDAQRRAQMWSRFGAVAGATGKTAASMAGGFFGGAKAGLKTKDITKAGEAVKTANKNREERELKADAGYHWYNPLPTMRDGILEFAGESGDTIKNRNQALRDRAKMEGDLAEGERVFNTYKDAEGKLDAGRAFRHDAYIQSYNDLGAAKKDAKNAEIALSQEQANLNAAYNYTGPNKEEVIANAQERYNIAYGNAKGTQGKLELAKAKHDSNKKIFADDAKVEDLFKYYSDLHSEIKPMPSVNPQVQVTSSPESVGPASRPLDINAIINGDPSFYENPIDLSASDADMIRDEFNRRIQEQHDVLKKASEKKVNAMGKDPYTPATEAAKEEYREADENMDRLTESLANFTQMLEDKKKKPKKYDYNLDVFKMDKSDLRKHKRMLEARREELLKESEGLSDNPSTEARTRINEINSEMFDLDKALERINLAMDNN